MTPARTPCPTAGPAPTRHRQPGRRPATTAGLPRIALLVAVAVGPVVAPAHALEDTAANRQRQAERYEQIMSADSVLDTAVRQIAVVLPPAHREPFYAYAMARIDAAAVRTDVLRSLRDTFTADELKAMADFFGSRLGRSVAQKMQTYRTRVMPEVMTRVQAVATEYARRNAPQ